VDMEKPSCSGDMAEDLAQDSYFMTAQGPAIE
jgi:hypothetical protein